MHQDRGVNVERLNAIPTLGKAVAQSRSVLPVILVSLAGVLFWASPIGQRLEQLFGLEWGFAVRGELSPPASVVYVPISDGSATQLHQPSADINLRGWDRQLFAKAVERLSDAGAAVVAFDIIFEDPDPQDPLFARAMDSAGNVLLLSWLQQSKYPASAGGLVDIETHSLHYPPAELGTAALATPPMMLRRDERADRFHAFPWAAGRQHASLPVVALYLRDRSRIQQGLRPCTAWYATLVDTGRPLAERLTRLRQQIETEGKDSSYATGSSDACQRFLDTNFGEVMSGPNEYYLNYYGDAGRLAGPPLHALLADDGEALAAALRGKVVFIGVADKTRINPPDLFRYAVNDDGISGVELIATAFANLAHQQSLTPIGRWQGVALLIGFGTLAGILLLQLPRGYTPWLITLCVVTYSATAWYFFTHEAVWMPIVTPLLVQLPLLLAVIWLSRLGKTEQLAQHLTHFLSQGMRKQVLERNKIDEAPELLYGICMHTDIAGYTSLSESFRDDPMRLKLVEKEYWAMLDSLVAVHDGERLEISGDGMLAVWAAPAQTERLNQRAVTAALAIAKAVDEFNQRHPDTPFVTRIALHAGQVALGLVGGSGHFTLTLGGDVANTTARLESEINKLLGTRLLISEAVSSGLVGIPVRHLGYVIPRGKQQVIGVVEPVEKSSRDPDLLEQFTSAIQMLRVGSHAQARPIFEALARTYPDDGPSRFYHRLLSGTAVDLPVVLRQDGVLDMNPQ